MRNERQTDTAGAGQVRAATLRRVLGIGAVALSVILAGATPVTAQGVDEVGLPLGTVPAAVQIEDLDGNPVDLGDYIGKKPVLLQFWATWCEQCKALEPRIDAAYERYGDQVEFLAISVAVNQTKRSIRRHLTKHPIPHTVLWDTEGRATRAFMAPTTSYVVILDGAGRVAYTGVGGDQDIEAALARVVK